MSLLELTLKSLRKGLVENCYNLSQKLNIRTYLARCKKPGVERLLHKVDDNIGEYFLKQIEAEEEFLNLNEEQMKVLLSLDSLNVVDEDPVLKSILQWFNYNPNERSKELPKLLELIRIPNLTPDYLQFLKKNLKVDFSNEEFSAKVDRFLHLKDEDSENHNNEFSKVKPRDGDKVIVAIGAEDGILRYFDFKLQKWVLSRLRGQKPYSFRILVSRNGKLYNLMNCRGYDPYLRLTERHTVDQDMEQDERCYDLMLFDLGNLEWKFVAHINDMLGDAAFCLMLEDKIYQVEGCNEEADQSVYKILDLHDENPQWKVQDEALEHEYFSPITSPSLVEINGLIYTVGLCLGAVYDPEKDEWERLEDLDMDVRDKQTVIAYNSKICFIGSFTSDPEEARECLCYNPSTQDWTSLPLMNRPRHKPNAVEYNGKLYVVGGDLPWDAGENVKDSENSEENEVNEDKVNNDGKEENEEIEDSEEIRENEDESEEEEEEEEGNKITMEVYCPEENKWTLLEGEVPDLEGSISLMCRSDLHIIM